VPILKLQNLFFAQLDSLEQEQGFSQLFFEQGGLNFGNVTASEFLIIKIFKTKKKLKNIIPKGFFIQKLAFYKPHWSTIKPTAALFFALPALIAHLQRLL